MGHGANRQGTYGLKPEGCDSTVKSAGWGGRRSSAGRNSAFSQVKAAAGGRLLVLPVTAVFALLTTRLIIRDAGPGVFALVSLVVSLSAFLPFADLGVGAAIVNATAESSQPASDVSLHGVIATSLRALVSSACLIVALDVGVTWLQLWPFLLGVHGGAAGHVNAGAGMVLFVFAASLPLSIGQRILLGLGRNGALSLLQGSGAPIAFLITAVAVHAKAGVPALAVAAPVGMLAAALLTMSFARRMSGLPLARLLTNVASRRRQPGSPIRRTAGPMLVITIGLPLALQTDRLILAHAGSVSDLASYALALQLYAPAWSVLAASGLALWPIFAKLRTDAPGASAALRRTLIGFAAVSLVGGVALLAAAAPLAKFLSGGTVAVSSELAAAFAGLLLVQGLQLPMGMFFTAPAGLRFQARCVTAMVPVSCVVSYALVAPFGAVGPVLGSIVGIGCCQLLPGAKYARSQVFRGPEAGTTVESGRT